MHLNLFKKYLFLQTSLSIILLNIDAKKINAQEEIIWEKIKIEKSINKSNKLIWEIYEEQNPKDSEDNSNKDNVSNFFDSNNEDDLNLEFLDYGYAVTSANSISENEIRIEIGQVSPFDGGVAGGTGNQNYFSRTF